MKIIVEILELTIYFISKRKMIILKRSRVMGNQKLIIALDSCNGGGILIDNIFWDKYCSE